MAFSSQAKMIDMLPVHARAGTLSTELATRQRPREQMISRMVELDMPRVHVLVPSAAINTVRMKSVLLAKSYSAFFPPEDEPPSAYALMEAIASFLTNMLYPRQVFRDGELQNAFSRAGMTLIIDNINKEEQLRVMSRDPRVIEFMRKFDRSAQIQFTEERAQQILCVGIILLTIGKNVNPYNYDGWIKNRIRTFSGALGIPEGMCIWTESQCPPQDSLGTSYSFLSASFTLRRLVFLICVSAARDTRRLSTILREVIMFLQGVEMGHILMIDRYIFSKYPELLRIRSLRDNMESMNTAWAYLASLEPGERYFAKILYNKDETAPLNRNNFTLLFSAAIAAAQFEIPSMRFFQGGNVTATTGIVAETVKSYLSLRINITHLAIMQSPYAYMSEKEKKKYIAQSETLFQGMSLLTLRDVTPTAEKG